MHTFETDDFSRGAAGLLVISREVEWVAGLPQVVLRVVDSMGPDAPRAGQPISRQEVARLVRRGYQVRFRMRRRKG